MLWFALNSPGSKSYVAHSEKKGNLFIFSHSPRRRFQYRHRRSPFGSGAAKGNDRQWHCKKWFNGIIIISSFIWMFTKSISFFVVSSIYQCCSPDSLQRNGACVDELWTRLPCAQEERTFGCFLFLSKQINIYNLISPSDDVRVVWPSPIGSVSCTIQIELARSENEGYGWVFLFTSNEMRHRNESIHFCLIRMAAFIFLYLQRKQFRSPISN